MCRSNADLKIRIQIFISFDSLRSNNGWNKVNLISQKFDGYWCESYTPICKGRSTWNYDYCPFKVVRFWFSNGGPHWYLSISHVSVCKTMYPNVLTNHYASIQWTFENFEIIVVFVFYSIMKLCEWWWDFYLL